MTAPTRRSLRSRFTYANVMATIAVALSLGGTAYGVSTLGSSGITDGSIRSIDVANESLAGVDVHNGTITKLDLAPAVAAGVGMTPVVAHTKDVYPVSGGMYSIGGQDYAPTTIKLPKGGNWLVDMTADFTASSGSEAGVMCVFLVDGQLGGLPLGKTTSRTAAIRLTFHEARQVGPGTHTVAFRCSTAGGEVLTPEIDLTVLAFRLP